MTDPVGREAYKGEVVDKIEAAYENAGNDYTPADEYEADAYIGKYNGIEYVLDFYNNTSNDRFVRTEIHIHANDISTVCPQEGEGYTTYMGYPDADIVENECKLSEAEAEKQAVEFMEKLGLEYPVLSDTRPLIWGDDSMSADNYQDWTVNGYVFRFAYGLEGVSFPGFGSDVDYAHSNVYGVPESDGKPYDTNATLVISVTEQGIINMDAFYPVKTGDITESVEILSLDEIKDIMKNQITENCEDFHFDVSKEKEIEFTDMELIYFRVTDNENKDHYSYIPAWRLSEQDRDVDGRNINNPVVINAIDGSVIKLQVR